MMELSRSGDRDPSGAVTAASGSVLDPYVGSAVGPALSQPPRTDQPWHGGRVTYATPGGKKELVGFQCGGREGAQSWRKFLIDFWTHFRRQTEEQATAFAR